MSDRETLDVYAARADDYKNCFVSDEADTSLTAFLAELPAGADVLDLGCGPGRSAGLMAKAGHRVTATDAVAEMVALAAEHPGVTARQESFDDLDGMALYHGIWANFSLLHAPREDLPRHLSSIATALKPAGIFHIGMKTGSDTARDALGRRYTYVTQDELTGLLEAQSLLPIRHWTGESPGLDGVVAPWIVMQARKSG